VMMTDKVSPSADSDANITMSLRTESNCSVCGTALCPRLVLINLATGRTEIMYCLHCLGKRENVQADQLLAKIRAYIFSRQCFLKEWIKYKDISFCADPKNCLPHNRSEE